MDFHWSLSDSKSPQVSKTVLSNLGNLKNAVLWMDSTCLLFSKSSSPFINPSVTVQRAPITIGINITFVFQFINSLTRSRYLYFSLSFNFFVVSRDRKVHNFASCLLFFVFEYYKVWSSGRDLVIHLFVKIPEEFGCVILRDRCGAMHIPFVRTIKCQLLAQF